MRTLQIVILGLITGWLFYAGICYLAYPATTPSQIGISLIGIFYACLNLFIFQSYTKEQRKQENRHRELQSLRQQVNHYEREIQQQKTHQHEWNLSKEHLVRLAHYDHVTTLPNRVFFNEILNKAIQHAKTHTHQLAVLFIDLDNFHDINHANGHFFGDLVLKEIGNRFKNVLRPGDIIGRLGGDGFIILLNDIEDIKYANTISQRLLQACAEPLHLDTRDLLMTSSIGISLFPDHGESMEALQKNADTAMYKAKHTGGATYLLYSTKMDSDVNEQLRLEIALRNALKNNEFILHFQPQIDLKSGQIKRLEALIRWNHPDFGLVSPAKFIPLAEETGLIIPIGEWALHEACRQNKEWQVQGYDPVTIAVNISPKQFRHQDVVEVVATALKESGLNPYDLELEITETAVMNNVDVAALKLKQLDAMGIIIAIDDFGTGYTSINYLRKFPVSVLKIDQTFIKGIPDSQNDIAITSAVIGLAHNLGLEVVAEGVETAEQLQFLMQHECDMAQGYFLSRPVGAGKIQEQLTKNGVVQDTIINV